jgi:YfiR/HmsC-like
MALLNRRQLLASLAVLASACVYGAAPTEYEVKAVFLFNFTQFVDWPAAAFSDGSSPLIIGVLGSDPFGEALEDAIQGETVNGRPLAVRRYSKVEDIDHCHVLFINLPNNQQLSDVLEQMRERSILTVSDSTEFARSGGAIQFITVDNKIRLQINPHAAKLANLTISSKLLRPARIVSKD